MRYTKAGNAAKEPESVRNDSYELVNLMNKKSLRIRIVDLLDLKLAPEH